MNGENKIEYLPLGSIVIVNGSVKKYVINILTTAPACIQKD